MLQTEQSKPVRSVDGYVEPSSSDDLAKIVYQILEFLRRQYPVIAIAAGIVIALGFVYLLTTPPKYTATATLLIDAKKVQLFQQQSMFADMPVDASTVESQVEILKSE